MIHGVSIELYAIQYSLVMIELLYTHLQIVRLGFAECRFYQGSITSVFDIPMSVKLRTLSIEPKTSLAILAYGLGNLHSGVRKLLAFRAFA